MATVGVKGLSVYMVYSVFDDMYLLLL